MVRLQLHCLSICLDFPFTIIKIEIQTTSILHNRDSQVTPLSPSCGTAVTLEWHCCRPRAALWASIRLQQLLPSGCISASIMLHTVSIEFHLCFHRVAQFSCFTFTLAQTQPPSCGVRVTYGQQHQFFYFLSVVVALIYIVSNQSPHPVLIASYVVVDISLRSRFVCFF